MRIRVLFSLLTLSLLASCSDPVEDARRAVAGELDRLGDEYKLLDARLYGENLVCGSYQRFGKWGEIGPERFYIYRNEHAQIYTSDDDLAVFCSDSPAMEVERRFGVVVTPESRQVIGEVIDDFTLLSDALERYYEQQGTYPTTEQGLAVLVEAPDGGQAAKKYPEGGYLSEVPVDPWKQPYHYQGATWGRVKSKFKLWTEGADHAAGGTGPAADIHFELLPYLEYLVER